MNPIKLLVLDVDGVLTDGGIFIDADGRETKRFHASDGVGLRTWARLGLPAAVITGRSGPAISHRLADLGVAYMIQGSKDKHAALTSIEQQSGVPRAAMAYVGDDWPDIPALRLVGYPIAVANAAPQVKAVAKFCTTRPGGSGAVREAIEHLLLGMGLLDRALALYDAP